MMNLLIKIGQKEHHLSVKPGTPLPEALALLGFSMGLPLALPCGGKGSCGKCRAKASGQLSPVTPAELRCLSAEELRNGVRLLCQTTVLGDACIDLPEKGAELVVEGVAALPQHKLSEGDALCAAIDIGTTTVAAQLYTVEGPRDRPAASAGRRNPQAAFGADVLSRMERAQAGEASVLRECILICMDELLTELLQGAGARPAQLRELVITGNTAMLYLLTGRDTTCLSKAPFLPEHLFGEEITAAALGLHAAENCRVYLPRCASAFIGADCLCAMLACGMAEAEAPCALLDLGTNGEMAVFNGAALWCASTAAGPAFEGAGLAMGMPAAPGAIDHVERKGFRISCTAIGGVPAKGICGSGLIDAAAVLRRSGVLDAEGTIQREGHPFRAMVCEIGGAPAVRFAGTGVYLTQADIRALQVAKAAVGAGLQTLLNCAGLRPEELARFSLAGGFGRFIGIENAARIGLFPSVLLGRAVAVGNAALEGAAMLALQPSRRARLAALAGRIHTVSLAEEPLFERAYLEGMRFPDDNHMDC